MSLTPHGPGFSFLDSFADTSKFSIDSIFSNSLNETRYFCVYLPKGFSSAKKYPVVYATDGQIITKEGYIKHIDSLIENHIAQPFVLIGAYSNEKIVEGEMFEYRNYEYVETITSSKDSSLNTLYKKHMLFFLNELIPLCEKKYSLLTSPKYRTFYGVSNGAAFGATLCFEHPKIFKNFILCSVAGISNSINQYLNNINNDFSKYDLSYYIAFGKSESDYELNNLQKFLTAKKVPFKTIVYDGAHERKLWQYYFTKYIVETEKMN